MNLKITVPYVSQYRDIQDKNFALTSCGMVSLYMVLLYFKKQGSITINQSLENMIVTGRETDGGYRPGVGWIHDYFIGIAQDHGLESYRKEEIDSFDEIEASLRNKNPVILSVERRCLTTKSFHMIVLIGIEFAANGKEIHGFYYHDPAALIDKDGADKFCTVDCLMQFWRKKAIFFNKK